MAGGTQRQPAAGWRSAVSALAEEIKAALREVLREELPLEDLRLFLARAAAESDRMLSVEEAAQRLGLSVSTVYKKSQTCELPSVKMGTRTLFRVADLDAYAAARRRSPERVRELVARA